MVLRLLPRMLMIYMGNYNAKDNISINSLRFGLTEEFLLHKSPGAPSLRVAQENFQKQIKK